MHGDPVDRRFTEEETRRIFERAADTSAGKPVSHGTEGLTLEEIRAIADEVGLDRSAVDRAAAEVASTREASGGGRQKFSSLVHEDMTIPRELSNDEMRGLVGQIEQVMGQRGMLSKAGPWVEWRDARDRLYVGLVRGDRVTRVRAIANIRGDVITGVTPIAVTGLYVLSAFGDSGVAVAAVVVGMVAATGMLLRWRIRAGHRYLRELLDIIREGAR